MAVRPRLTRSIPFWILLIGSLAVTAYGAWLVVDRISTMNATITAQTATGVEVYGGQAWVTLGAALVGAGVIGLVASLFLAVLRSFVPATIEVVEPVEWSEESLADAPAAEGQTDAAADLGYEARLGYADAPEASPEAPSEASVPVPSR
jgi:threonine dehydrogenase-like Zn-dependent dehydrogenase